MDEDFNVWLDEQIEFINDLIAYRSTYTSFFSERSFQELNIVRDEYLQMYSRIAENT